MKSAIVAAVALFVVFCISGLSFAQDVTYQTADLIGTWNGNSLANGPSAPWWERSSITIAADGSFTGTSIESDGSSSPLAGTFNISSEGIVTLPGYPDLQCSVNSGKTVFVCTNKWSTGSSELKIFTKQPATCSQSDLTGNWISNGLQSGPTAPWWGRGVWSIDENGLETGTMNFQDGSSENVTAFMSISNDCTITPSACVGCGGNNGLKCVLAEGKTIIACTGNVPGGNSEIVLMTKKADSYSTADLEGKWGVHNLATADSSENWSLYGTVTIDANGSATGLMQESDESEPGTWSGAFGISADGIVTGMSGLEDSGLQCSMDAGKTLIVCTGTQSTGSSEMPIFTKLTASSGSDNCAATLAPDLTLHVPVITYGGDYYWADFAYVPNTSDFNLTNAGVVTDPAPYSGCQPATFSPDFKLHIPEVIYGGTSYWADMIYTQGTTFTVTGAGQN